MMFPVNDMKRTFLRLGKESSIAGPPVRLMDRSVYMLMSFGTSKLVRLVVLLMKRLPGLIVTRSGRLILVSLRGTPCVITEWLRRDLYSEMPSSQTDSASVSPGTSSSPSMLASEPTPYKRFVHSGGTTSPSASKSSAPSAAVLLGQ